MKNRNDSFDEDDYIPGFNAPPLPAFEFDGEDEEDEEDEEDDLDPVEAAHWARRAMEEALEEEEEGDVESSPAPPTFFRW